MIDFTTNYMGLQLKNPIIIGSSGLTGTLEGIKKLEENGAGAVVLKSIFEEQIMHEIKGALESQDANIYPEAFDYISNYAKDQSIGKYLSLIESVKRSCKIPIIASINCFSSNEWVSYAKKMQIAGADAIELNIFILPSDLNISGAQVEQKYFDIIEKVKAEITIPLSIKLSSYNAGLSNFIQRLSWTGNLNGMVFFNRFYSPDIDIDTMKVTSTNVFSSSEEVSLPLRWVALLSDKINVDIAASTGIHNGKAVIKQILAGAKAVQIASAIYKMGPEYIKTILNEMEDWMKANKFSSIEEFRGKMSQEKIQNPAAFERVQFMKYFSGIE